MGCNTLDIRCFGVYRIYYLAAVSDKEKGTNAGIIVLLCVSIWFYNTLKGAVLSGVDSGLYKKEAEEVVSLTEEQAFIHERDLGIYAEEPIDRYGIKDHTYWESWENYSIRERKGNEEWSPAIFYYNMSCSDYGWILNMEQNMAMHATKELEKEIAETWMNGVWVRSGPYSEDDAVKRTMIFRCDEVLVQLDYMSDRTSMGEKEIMEYVTEKVREKAEAME